ncbi:MULTISPECIES: YkyA family protein [Staphylococcus]|uniref:YkyA family protein n=1 Tax=Staphylococcus TaxID=1279 RepID=UPI00069F96DC|nr:MULTISPECIES: YkyA family protein [Staphylococcus]MBE7379724.1 YkyA family protein [Staphylococcus haemolyticus]MCC3663823.1 YkyA family protein [Staphylococcus haemolyticus]MCH4347223.1 YkyA family protein [Staphylococcus haemolyticus]MCH4349445.1 YkyA family protein [Staphylococcus haemolyticus]MCH4358515.1 YkyA family protein [Staphylococcus haemolyticus]
MKLRKTVAVVAASTVLLAGCTTDKKEVKAYNENVQKAFDKEQPINSISKKLNSLEEKKQDLYKKANSDNEETRKKAADDILDNIKQREDTFDKEIAALDDSKKQFNKGESHIKEIKSDDKKKELKELDDAVKNKYKVHDKYADAYKNVLDKEKDLFELIKQDGITQSQVDEKNDALNKAQKNFQDKFKEYSKAMNTVNKEKQDVDNL